MPRSELPDPRPEILRLVRESTVHTVAKRLGMSREQVARLAGGLPVRNATLAMARECLAEEAKRVAGCP